MSYRLTERKIPIGTKPIKFHFKNNPKFGMLNMCCWKNEINQIEDPHKKIINRTKIHVYFPMFEYFYVKTYESKSGFTFKQLFDRIVRTGMRAGTFDTENNPDHYVGPATAEDFIGEYAITSNNRTSDIKIRGANVYVSIQH